jgi:hypothetical protein
MPALNGQIIVQLTTSTGAPAVTVTWFFNPANSNLRNNPAQWVAPDGTVYPAGTGALIADNQLGRAVRMRINDAQGNQVRRVQIPAGGRSVTAAQLAAAPAPDGPYVTSQDLNGLTFDLS